MKSALLCLVLVCTGFASIGFGQASKKRDITVYDDGGLADFGWGVMSDHKIRGARLREFIWTHLIEKSRGHIIAAFYTLEGDPTYEHIFVEPNAKGDWQIVIESERHCCWFYTMEKPRKRRTVNRWTEIYLAAVRTQASYNGPPATLSPDYAGGELLDVDDPRPSSKYRLGLKRTASSDVVKYY